MSSKKKNNFLIQLAGLTSLLIIFAFVGKYINTQSEIKCANTGSCKESFTLKVENSAKGIFSNQTVIPPQIDLSTIDLPLKVLGDSDSIGEKRVEVDLSSQTLTAYEGDNIFMKTLISSGKWAPTPPGEYSVWIKLKATRMSGGEGADYYDLPNVPYVMFFYNSSVSKSRGFALHGAYWHNNFGHAMSHGCVNMRIDDAQKLYNWINPKTESNTTYANKENPGTKIIIYGEAP